MCGTADSSLPSAGYLECMMINKSGNLDMQTDKDFESVLQCD